MEDLVNELILFAAGAIAASIPNIFDWLKAKAEKSSNKIDDALVELVENVVEKALKDK